MTDNRRKITFYLNPETNDADALTVALINGQPLGERGRVNRSLLVAGAALRVLDSRLPDMLTAAFREGVTRDELVGCLVALLPSMMRVATSDPVVTTTPDKETANNMLGLLGKK